MNRPFRGGGNRGEGDGRFRREGGFHREERNEGGFRQGGFHREERNEGGFRQGGFRREEPRRGEGFRPEGNFPPRRRTFTPHSAPRPEPEPWTPVDGESGVVVGLHAVESLLSTQAGRVQRVLFLHGSGNEALHRLQARADELGIPCQQLEQRQLDIRAEGRRNGGVVALCNARDYVDWADLRAQLLESAARGEAPMVVVGAAIEDPRNLGAIVRSAVGLGARALILPKKGGCGLTGIVEETSAGALTELPVTRPSDLESVLKDLGENGFQVVGLDAGGTPASQVDLTGPLVLVAGGEDRGLPPHLRRPCQVILSLPMDRRLQSYNASVAAALALYEAVRQRGQA